MGRRKFSNVNEIREHFLKTGWCKEISFYELTAEEASAKGYLFACHGIQVGRKYFVMNGSENVYNEYGDIACFHIPCHAEGAV